MILSRRQLVWGSAFFLTPGLFAERLAAQPLRRPTAALTEGPFYPDRLPLDRDNDLLIVDDSITPAVGEVAHLTGRVLTASGAPVNAALVEIWQVDSRGSYLHSRGASAAGRDRNFQGYGRFLTDAQGRYRFRTIKPIAYTQGGFRAPHIHVAVSRNDRRIHTTQLMVRGDPDNRRDGILSRLAADERDTVLAAFTPAPGRPGELAVAFDVVLGRAVL